ncbi:MAG: polymer-forming cytoskeletal protein [Spirochaetes bacterium]|nr:polymer-forming cytoskeletal protein [Spirochaetota bacterium]
MEATKQLSLKNIQSDNVISNFIFENTKLKGEFELNTVLRIDGEFSGKIKSTSKVIIGTKGKAFCDIEADIIEIGGEFIGNIIAKTFVKVYSTGKVTGNIITPKILIEEGVKYNGEIKVKKTNEKNI